MAQSLAPPAVEAYHSSTILHREPPLSAAVARGCWVPSRAASLVQASNVCETAPRAGKRRTARNACLVRCHDGRVVALGQMAPRNSIPGQC